MSEIQEIIQSRNDENNIQQNSGLNNSQMIKQEDNEKVIIAQNKDMKNMSISSNIKNEQQGDNSQQANPNMENQSLVVEEFDLETFAFGNFDQIPFQIDSLQEIKYFQENMVKKFPGCVVGEDPDALVFVLRKQISKKYVKLFAQLPQPKEELINIIIYTLGWMSHYLFYKYFSKQRFFFDLRFIFDCYHILILEFNGVYISDYYIKLNFERVFTNRFLCYEQLGKPKRKPVNARPTKFLGNFEFQEPNIESENGQEFRSVLNDMWQTKKKVQAPTRLEDDMYNEIQRENLLQKTGSKSVANLQQHNYDYQNISPRQRSPESTNKGGIYFGNVSLNCTQVSPTVANILYYENMQLPYMKKKVIKHNLDTISGQNKDLYNKVKALYKNKGSKKEVKIDKKYRQQLVDIFSLRQPAKEYYQKHSNLDKMFKDMLDLNYVFSNYREKLLNLPSSVDVLKNYEFHKKNKEAKLHMRMTKQILEKEALEAQEREEEIKRIQRGKIKMKIGEKFNKIKSPGNSSPAVSVRNLEEDGIGSFMKLPGMPSSSFINTPKQSLKPGDLGSLAAQVLNQNATNIAGNSPIPNSSFKESANPIAISTFSNMQRKPSQLMNIGGLTLEKGISYKGPKDIGAMQYDERYHKSIQTYVLEGQNQQNYFEYPTMKAKGLMTSNGDFVYRDKRSKYKDKYQNIGKYDNTDKNIDNLQADLMQRQNLVNKGMKQRVHKARNG